MLQKMLRIAFLVLATLALLATAEEPEFSIKQVQRECLEEFKLDEETIAKLNSTKYLETKDQKVQCFVKCFLTGLSMMNDEGDVTLEHFRRLNNTKGLEIAEKCGNINGTDACDKAVNLQNCLVKTVSQEEQPPE